MRPCMINSSFHASIRVPCIYIFDVSFCIRLSVRREAGAYCAAGSVALPRWPENMCWLLARWLTLLLLMHLSMRLHGIRLSLMQLLMSNASFRMCRAMCLNGMCFDEA